MHEPIRVLHASMPTVAGVPTVLLGYVSAQVRSGFSVAVACPAEGWLPAEASAVGAQVLPWPARRSPGPDLPSETRRLARLISHADPDIVHLHSAKAGLAGRLAVRGRRPTVFQPHAWSFLAVDGPTRAATRLWERFASGWTDVVICVSDAERTAGEGAGVSAPTRVIRNGIDGADLPPDRAKHKAAVRAELGLPPGPLAVCVGRVCAQKGQADLLDAWPAVQHAVEGACLALVGDGPDRTMLEQRVGSDPTVVLAGERRDVRGWLAAADVIVAPSRWEGMALVPLEAMACARSVVVTDVCGARESVPDGVGAVVPVGDRAALAAEVALRLSDDARASAEGMEGRRHVLRHHDPDAAAEAVMAVYRDVLQHRCPVSPGGSGPSASSASSRRPCAT